jgi:hypothetical protein
MAGKTRSRRDTSNREPIPRARASTRRHPDPEPDTPQDISEPEPKKKKLNSTKNAATRPFLNPFPPAAQPESHTEEFSVPHRAYTQVPLDKMTYGFTPSRTMSQIEANASYSRDSPSVAFDMPSNASSSSNSDRLHNIDPSLTLNHVDSTFSSLETPRQPSSSSARSSDTLRSDTRSARSTSSGLSDNTAWSAALPPHNLPAKNVPIPRPILQRPPPQPAFVAPTSPTHSEPDPFPPMTALRTPAPIPKAVTDRLLNHEDRLLELERTIQRDQKIIHQLRTSNSALQSEFDDLDNEQRQTLQRLDGLEDLVQKQSKTIDNLIALIENMDGGPPAWREEETVKGVRDNAFNVTISPSLPTSSLTSWFVDGHPKNILRRHGPRENLKAERCCLGDVDEEGWILCEG